MLFRFFFYFLFMFNKACVRKFMKKVSLFNKSFQNSFQDVENYGLLECQTLQH